VLAAGLVASLAHTGGNVTGLARLSQELSAKRLALLKETVPAISRTETAARGLGVNVRAFPIRDFGALDSAFAGMGEWRADSLVVVPSSVLWDHRSAIVRLAEKHRLAAIFPEHEFVEAGGLMAYGASLPDQFRRAATYVDKILKGGQTGRHSHRATDEARSRHQPQDRQGAGADDPALVAAPHGSRDRIGAEPRKAEGRGLGPDPLRRSSGALIQTSS
jgi:ABC-type uncharacterized transport system substrate-binding protein